LIELRSITGLPKNDESIVNELRVRIVDQKTINYHCNRGWRIEDNEDGSSCDDYRYNACPLNQRSKRLTPLHLSKAVSWPLSFSAAQTRLESRPIKRGPLSQTSQTPIQPCQDLKAIQGYWHWQTHPRSFRTDTIEALHSDGIQTSFANENMLSRAPLFFLSSHKHTIPPWKTLFRQMQKRFPSSMLRHIEHNNRSRKQRYTKQSPHRHLNLTEFAFNMTQPFM